MRVGTSCLQFFSNLSKRIDSRKASLKTWVLKSFYGWTPQQSLWLSMRACWARVIELLTLNWGFRRRGLRERKSCPVVRAALCLPSSSFNASNIAVLWISISCLTKPTRCVYNSWSSNCFSNLMPPRMSLFIVTSASLGIICSRGCAANFP